MSLATRLTLMLAAGLLAVAGIGAAGLWLLHGAVRTYATEVQQLQRRASEVSTLRAQFQVQVQEWKNLLLRGADPAARDKYWQAFGHSEKAVADTAQALLAALPAGRSRELVQAFASAHAQMGQAYRRGYDKFRDGGHVAAVGDAAVKGIDREPLARLAEAFELINREAAAGAAEADRDGARALYWAAGLMALLTPAVGLACWWVLRAAMRRLGAVVQAVERVSAGDLTHALPQQGRDELARLAAGLSEMQRSLSRLVAEVRRNADSVATASGEIAQGNLDLSGRTEQQAAALQQSAATMDELAATVRQNAENARSAEDQARAATAVAERGGAAMGDVVRTMQGIAEASRRIADIIGTIDGIAFQTNILALNAAVEAARAGEQGRGFAVVAGEVRSLAQRSAQAAREIKSLIGASVTQVDQGDTLVQRAGGTMAEVVQAVQGVSQLIAGISSASQEQSHGVQQLGQAMAQMDQATQQNAALVEQSAAAAESLRQQSQRLVQAVSVFRVDAATAAA